MKVFNKSSRTVQFEGGEIEPQEVVELDNKEGEKLTKLFAGELVNLADSEKELTKGSKKKKKEADTKASKKKKEEADTKASE